MAKKKKEKKMTKARYRMRLIRKILLLLLLITILLVGVVLYLAYGRDIIAYHDEAKRLIATSSTETFRQSETSLVYDANGKQLATLKGEKDVYYLAYEDIPEYVKQAMISIEDKKFEKHKGIDIKGIIRALKAYVVHRGEITQGASTITQQLSRNIFLTHEVSWERKVKEMFIALEMEKKYTKSQILEFYLNNIYFGNGYYGIQAASKGYFSKTADKLTLGEITFLCAIPNNPTLYDPLVNYDNTIKRKNRIIDQMYEDGKISEAELNSAKGETVTLNVKKKKKKNTYIETYVYNCAVRALMEKQGFVFRYSFESDEERDRYEERYDEVYAMCQQSLFSAGYRIYTSIDPSKQKQLQESVDNALEGFQDKSDEGIYKLQGAATCIDNETGRVVAIVGGRSQKTAGYTLNRAFQSYRQPGSAIKPLIVYTPILEKGYRPDTMVDDKRTEDGPRNASGTYEGKITLRKAVEKSKNTVAWELFKQLTPRVGLQYLLDMDFAKIEANDYYPAASLGGFTKGTSTVEMASGFAAIENDGKFRKPTCIVKIKDSQGDTIVEDKTETRDIYETEASRMMTNILEGVFTNGTGRGLGLSNMSAAGKTGTTSDKKDGWFVGYTPYYTTSVWVGYDIPQTLSNLSGASYPGTIWHNFMEAIHMDLPNREFPAYAGASKSEDKVNTEDDDAEEETIQDEVTEEETIPELEDPEEEDTEEEKPIETTPPPTKKPDTSTEDENNSDDNEVEEPTEDENTPSEPVASEDPGGQTPDENSGGNQTPESNTGQE
ncbi:PBP1A family penicillin-binding protein [Velocimicrobium porci]|uniref:Penicillin-binding protein 1A n=1 Tax=Velocimicrobium porci TaxID=2606634 RepID=A0A6L5XY80_9FIRM|nr:PBP1A family penicillin-binding protein [Velocimicrobium porci]MSS62903.1 PBP1A family penicillin-binding protein [Velocimicrobium porci]